VNDVSRRDGINKAGSVEPSGPLIEEGLLPWTPRSIRQLRGGRAAMRSLRYILAACLLLAASFLEATPARPAPGAVTTEARQIAAYIAPYAAQKQFSGVLLVTRHGRVVFERAYGSANAELAVPNNPGTVFGIASLTKMLTTTIRQRLVDEGIISDSDHLSKFIPDFPHGDQITIDMLARHQSGIPHRVTTAEEEAVPAKSTEVVERIKKAELRFTPGSQRLYSSSGYSVLARAMEVATGKSYAELLRAYIFDPAGMTSSTEVDGELIKGRAEEYLLSPAGLVNAPLKDYSYLVGAGSVFSTAGDLLKFGEAVLGGRFGAAVKARLAPNGVLTGNGVTNGHRAFIKLDEKNGTGTILVSNLNSGANDLILQNVDAIMAGHKAEKPVIPTPQFSHVPMSELVEYAGTYVPVGNPTGLPLDLVAAGGALRMSDWTLYPTSKPGCFFEYQSYGEMCFGTGSDGNRLVRWQSPTFTGEWTSSVPR
jgi:CubicO group peptidase (beta-lactamase class C family)